MPTVPLISDSEVALVRERSPIEVVVGETVTLKRAGRGSLKGLCPFHDEKTPSFTVNPERGVYNCFGCGKYGDVIAFVRETEALSFPEAVERLAQRAGITLTYERGTAAAGRQSGERQRLLTAHTEAAAFYAGALDSEDAATGRNFLINRGFPAQTWAQFGVGYAPQSWDALTKHLTAKGYSQDELVTAGLARRGQQRGVYDSFRGRLVWPIRGRAGETLGFGARKLYDDDQGPKYLNTGETPLYRKSSVLYGLDLARREIALRHQAVIVEGYTDVMAAHLAGVSTAVATCGTAFGTDHADLLRRVLLDQEETPGEIIFTFDGDAAGQKAALRAFELDQRFVSQTFVAVGPDGMDPCELRLAQGDAAVRDLVASRVPLFTFVLRATIARYDLDTPDGRVGALGAAAPVVAGIRDRALRPEYARTLAGWLGMDVEAVIARVGELAGRETRPPRGTATSAAAPTGALAAGAPTTQAVQTPASPAAPAAPTAPSLGGRADQTAVAVEREALKLAVQRPALAAPVFDGLLTTWFVDPAHRALRDTIAAAGGTSVATGDSAWVQALLVAAPDDSVRAMVHALAVEPVHYNGDDEQRYVSAVLARVEEIAVTRELAEAKGRLERTNPESAGDAYRTLFSHVISLETRKRSLRSVAVGSV